MGFELNFENFSGNQQTPQNVRADMAAVARLGGNLHSDLPTHSLDQLMSNDKFPSLDISDNRGERKTERAGNSSGHGGLHEIMKNAITHAQKFHAAMGVKMSAMAGPPKEGSGCPAAALRKTLFGGPNNASGAGGA